MLKKEQAMPSPSYMSEEQMAQYLSDLRANRLAKPSGSRPPPPSKFTSLKRAETHYVNSEHANLDRPSLPTSNSMPTMPVQTLSHCRTASNLSTRSPFAGRPLARSPSVISKNPQMPSEQPESLRRTSSMQYMENGTRWMEKQEVKSIRAALEDMDQDEERKVHAAAQDEAAELVWKHQNPDAPYANSETPYQQPDLQKDYRLHLRKGSYQQYHRQEQVPTMQSRKLSHGSGHTSMDVAGNGSTAPDTRRRVSPPIATVHVQKTRTPSGKSYGGLAEAVKDDIVKAERRTSSGSKRIMSGEKKMYMQKSDRIWEDPQEEATSPKKATVVEVCRPAPVPSQPGHIRKNPFARMKMQQDKILHSQSAPVLPLAKHYSVEIQKNPPSQSRKAWYMSNEPLTPTPPSLLRDDPADDFSPKNALEKEGMEIRGHEIRAATTKQWRDRSPNLPQPTMVSDKPERPIVSFQQDRKPKEVVLEEVHSKYSCSKVAQPVQDTKPVFNPAPYVMPPKLREPSGSHGDAPKPPVPTICIPDDPAIPSIVLPEDVDSDQQHMPPVPAAPATNGEPPAPPKSHSRRPLPTPTPHHAATSPLPRSTPHYTPSMSQSGALCARCALPIAGRILSAAGQRFHPSCFVCHQCSTNLELVAFYPEPETKRQERLDRIAARLAGCTLDNVTRKELVQQEVEDGDAGWRFYCHLDFHELFSPRCKSCKTPIEGEVVVACGAEWHVGHFFCAQCGDPFDRTTPFVEKDGYAWCVGCHTNRYASKCRKCRKPVTDLVVKALGADWHDRCFACMQCDGEFEDGRYFLRGDSADPVCVKCEEKRLKA